MSKEREYGTFIHGIAASEHLDSSGERIVIDGVDISSLTVDGVLNWEHKNENASQIVGKILQAKKILKKEDCETEAQKYFWDKVKCPYLYVAGELFDHVGHGAAEDVAAMLKYDKGLNKDETKALINFSIEGSTLKKEGSVIHKCIGRKVTITITPCNKMAFAEHMEEPTDKSKTMGSKEIAKDILSKFRKSEQVEVEMLQKAAGEYMTQLANVKGIKQPKSPSRDYKKIGPSMGEQRAGKEIKPKREFTQTDAPDKLKVGDRIKHTTKKPKTGHSIYNDPDTWKKEGKSKVEQMKLDLKKKKKKKLSKYDSNVRKALVAGSGMGAPESKTGGEALQAECLDKKIEKICKKKVYKSLSEDAWSRIEKKEQLIEIIKKKSPDMSDKEVLAVAKTMAYAMEKKEEMKLEGLTPRMDVKENFKTPTSGSAGAKVPKEEKESVEKANRYEKERNLDSKMKQRRRIKRDDSNKKRKPKNLNTDQYESAKRSARTAMTMDKKPGRSKAAQRDLDQSMADIKHTHKEDKKFNQPKLVPKGKDSRKEDTVSDTKLAASEKDVSLKSKHKSKKGGLTQAGRDHYNKKTGSNLKAPVSSKAAKKSPKKAKRRKSFCARMSGAKGAMYEYKDTDRDGDKEKVPTRKKKALDRWDC